MSQHTRPGENPQDNEGDEGLGGVVGGGGVHGEER